MRSRNYLILVGLISVIAIGVFALGCSDDASTISTIPPEDNGIESMLDEVAAQVHEYLDSTVVAMEAGLVLATWTDVGAVFIGDILMGPLVPDSTTDRGWIISWVTDLQAGVGTLNIIDSLTYVVNGEYRVEGPNADQMYIKHNYLYEGADTTVTFDNLSNRIDLHVDNIDTRTATINGEVHTVIYQKNVTDNNIVWNRWVLQATLTNLEMTKRGDAWRSGCPETGTCDVEVQHTYAMNLDIPVTTIWDFDITFTNGLMDVDVSTGQLSASYEETLCTP